MDSKINKSIIYYVSIFFSGIIFILFAKWFLENESSELLPTIFSIFTIVMVTVLIQKAVVGLEKIWYLDDKKEFRKLFSVSYIKNKEVILIAAGLLVWVLMMNILIIVFVEIRNPNVSFLNAYESNFNYYLNTSDYFNIADIGYGEIKNPENYKWIYPLYPWIIKVLDFFGNKYVLATILNSILYVCSGVLIYVIGLFDYSNIVSIKSVIYFALFPLSFLLITPVNLGLLLFLILLYVYFVLNREWRKSFFVGMLLGFTDPYSLILVVFSIIELVSMSIEEEREQKLYGKIRLDKTPMDFLKDSNKNFSISRNFRNSLTILGIPLASIFYLWINREFLIKGGNIILHINNYIQGEKKYFFSNGFELLNIIFNKGGSFDGQTLNIYLPIIISIVLTLVILMIGSNKIRGSYFVYSVILFIVIYGSKNVLKTNKYLNLLFPIHFIFGNLSHELVINISIVIILFILFVLYFSNFLLGTPVF